jgi:hypothetical protein
MLKQVGRNFPATSLAKQDAESGAEAASILHARPSSHNPAAILLVRQDEIDFLKCQQYQVVETGKNFVHPCSCTAVQSVQEVRPSASDSKS